MILTDIRKSPDGRYDLWIYKELAGVWKLVSWGHDSYKCACYESNKIKGGKL